MSNLGNKQIMADNLNHLIESRGLNKKEFASDINVPYTTVLGWTTGTTYPRIDKIEIMANYFKVDKSDLVEERQSMRSPSRSFLMDQIKTADEDDLRKMEQLWRMIHDTGE